MKDYDMTQRQWEKIYKPISKLDVSWFKFPEGYEPSKIWTIRDLDGKAFIVNGYHITNSLAYYVTEIPYEGEYSLIVKAKPDW